MEKLEDALYKLIMTTGGRALVLFTSHRILREAYRRLKPSLEIQDICLLGHGIDGSRSRLLEEFKGKGRTALFGSLSFWEGIDVPGDALTCVIIVKLPFSSPYVPIIEARLEDLARQGKDGFRVLSVPQAVIRFKQGFGRLIRSSSDRGCVVVLDGRVLNRSYGRQFLISLPVKRHIRGEIDFINKKVAEWLENNQNISGI
jgi:ATP-dependent DNA helicase DinG